MRFWYFAFAEESDEGGLGSGFSRMQYCFICMLSLAKASTGLGWEVLGTFRVYPLRPYPVLIS